MKSSDGTTKLWVAGFLSFVVVVSGASLVTAPSYVATVTDDGGFVTDASTDESAMADPTLSVSYDSDATDLTQVDVYRNGTLVTRFDVTRGNYQQTIQFEGTATRTYTLVAHNRTGAVVGRASVRVRDDGLL